MKVAILSPIAWRTPPRHYGPWEQVASTLTEALIAKGIEVTLFASGDSITRAKLDAACNLSYNEDPEQDPKVLECLHISNLMEKASNFDIIHNHFDFLPLTYSGLIKTPLLTTIHGFSSKKILPVYKKYNQKTHYVSISNSDRSPQLDYLATIYHGMDPANFTFRKDKENYLLYFGRIHPEKGAHIAIEIAKKTGYPLKIAGLIQDKNYFENEVKPHINNKDIVYLGNLGPADRNLLMGNAKALLHPIFFEEPFGLSVAEAFFCGTPVIAFSKGSMPELIKDSKTGFLVTNLPDAINAVKKLSHISAEDCREHAIKNFSHMAMAEAYIQVYKKILKT